MKLRDQVLNSEVLKLENDNPSVLGPGLILNSCILDSKIPADCMIIAGLTMISSNFNQHVELKDFHFENAHLNNVIFTGKFIGCDFGDWDDTSKSSINNCDFKDCHLDGVRFLNADVDTIALPKWPHFFIRSPEKCDPNINIQGLPKKLGITLNVYFDEEPECSAIVGNAQRLADENGISIDEIREILSSIEGIEIKD